MAFSSGETKRFSWDFSEKASGADVFVNIAGTNINVAERLNAARDGKTVLRPNPLNPGTYTACVTVKLGESGWECLLQWIHGGFMVVVTNFDQTSKESI